MAKKDFTKFPDGSIFRTRDEYLSKDKFDKGNGHYRKIVKIGCNNDNTGICVVKLQSEGNQVLKHSNINSSYNPIEYTTDNNNKPINESYKFKTTKFKINELDLIYMQELTRKNRNKIIRKNYAIRGKKKKTSK